MVQDRYAEGIPFNIKGDTYNVYVGEDLYEMRLERNSAYDCGTNSCLLIFAKKGYYGWETEIPFTVHHPYPPHSYSPCTFTFTDGLLPDGVIEKGVLRPLTEVWHTALKQFTFSNCMLEDIISNPPPSQKLKEEKPEKEKTDWVVKHKKDLLKNKTEILALFDDYTNKR